MEKSIDLLISIPDQAQTLMISPASLADLLSNLAAATSKLDSSISVLYNRKGAWLKIADNATYTSIITKALTSNADEIELKVEYLDPVAPEEAWDLMSDLSRVVLEDEKKLEEPLVEESKEAKASLYYRYLNGSNPANYIAVKIESFDISLLKLSEHIVKLEGLKSEEWVCAFYTEEGSPITGTLSQMNFALCSELIVPGSRLNVFIVPNFDIKSAEKLEPKGPNTLTLECLGNESLSFTFNIDISVTTVMNLKQVVYHFTNIPTYEITLKFGEGFLARRESLLSEYQVIDRSKILFIRNEVQYSSFTYKPYSKQSIIQTEEGLRNLHSFLHSYSKLLEISERPLRESLLAYVRHFSLNNSPYITALYHISKGKSSSLLTSIALEEGSMLLSRHICQNIFKETVEESKLLEHIIEVFGFLSDLSSNPNEELSRDEIFKEFEIVCPLTKAHIKDPVLIKRTDTREVYYEREELIKKFKADEEVKFVVKKKENELKVDESFKLVIKRAILNGYDDVYLWEGIFDTTRTLGQLVSEKYPQGVTLAKATELKRAYKITKPAPPLSLKTADTRDCMTYNKSKELVVSLGPSNKEPNKVDLMNILKRTVIMVDIDDLASAIEMSNPTEIGQEVFTRNPDEAIVVVFDISGSMGTKFFDEVDFTRLDATKEFFETFTDRNAGFDYSHVISLVLFQNSIKRACGFTENIVTFASHVQNAISGGGTKLWDALTQAISYLCDFKKTYGNAHLRILCLSDGEDTSSKANYTTVAKALVNNNITMDSICVGDLSQQLKAASFASGGYVFLPRTIPEGIKLFESETFLSVRARTVPTRTLVNSEADLIPLISKEFSNAQPVSASAPVESKGASVSMKAMLTKIASQPAPVVPGTAKVSAGALKRITKELQDLSNDPHPNFSVYPSADDMFFWNVFMTGPDTTPYEGGTFQLYVRLPSDYPFKPPAVKFITRIYHCNINAHGSICHAILKDQWSPALTLKRVFDSIFGLLLTPEPLDPLDANIASEYRLDYDLFLKKACEFTRTHAMEPIERLLVKENAQKLPPPQFLCGITGKIMTDPVMVVKSNNSYERSEIEAVIDRTGKEPKTGEDITRADLVTNVGIMCAIQEFNKLNAPAHP